jgi:hypothetical protein
MRELLSRRRYEVLALLTFAVFGYTHLVTSEPLMGLGAKGDVVHRFVQNLDGRVTNTLFRLRGERPAHPDVVVMEIDERGAQRYGLWPWPRDVLATALDATRRIALLVQPFIPDSAAKLLDQLGVGTGARDFKAIDSVVAAGTPLPAPQGVFPRWVEAKA